MLFKFLTLITGILLTGFSLTFIIIYINLLSIGYTFINYVNYIIREKIYYLSNLKKQAEEMQEKISLLTLNDYDASRYIQSFLF